VALQLCVPFFSRSDTTLTKVCLDSRRFCTAEDASILFAAFHRNITVTDFCIKRIEALERAALGHCLARLMHNMAQLRRLECSHCYLEAAGVRAFQPTLQSNRTLKELILKDIRLLADALVGDDTLEILDIGSNHFTSVGLDEITRVIESTRLQMINLRYNYDIFAGGNTTRRFAVSRHEFLKHLNVAWCKVRDQTIRIFTDALVGNTNIEVLEIELVYISSVGLDDVTRLIQSTRIKSITMEGSPMTSPMSFRSEAATRHFFRAVSRHGFLKVLDISWSQIGDGDIRIIADEFAGNTIMKTLDISMHSISHVGLADITRLLVSTGIMALSIRGNRGSGVFVGNEDTTQHFVTTLRDKQSSVQELPNLTEDCFPDESRVALYSSIKKSLLRNKQLNRVDLLLAPPPPVQHDAAVMMFKTWHKTIMKLAVVPKNAVASAIFKLVRDRPAFLENRIQGPSAAIVLDNNINSKQHDAFVV
jgi:hypothetical protein